MSWWNEEDQTISGNCRCPKCGAARWSKWVYMKLQDMMLRTCRACGYEEQKVPLDKKGR